MSFRLAYFSAEIGIENRMKTYSGGLGILAGDTVKAMADLQVNACAISLLYKEGFLKQKINRDDVQEELPDFWPYWDLLEEIDIRGFVNILGHNVYFKAWKLDIVGATGHRVPVYFLDTNVEENSEFGKSLTRRLYSGDRLAQEMLLGIGGVRLLKAIEVYDKVERFHLNEGHSAFLTLEVYRDLGEKYGYNDEQVRGKCVFTTHTPIPAGHDKFEYDDFYEHFKGEEQLVPWHLKTFAGEDKLNMTKLAMNFCGYTNAVSKKHGEVSREMFPMHRIDSITNGIYSSFWASAHMRRIFDSYLRGWRQDFSRLSDVFKVPNSELFNAHIKAKHELIDFVNENNVVGSKLDKDTLTIGFARRFIKYKDADLILQDLNRLKELKGKVQFVFAGKTHPNDGIGKEIMQRVIRTAKSLVGEVNIAFIEDYCIDVAQKMISGSDLWLNTPVIGKEASGTSGMKAAVNGVPHFSRLDGWAIEGYEMNGGGFPLANFDDFHTTLKYKIIPMYYSKNKVGWVEEMKLSIGTSGSYFNTHRMVKEYIQKAYKFD